MQMKEVSLSELEIWYKDQLKNRFKKEHKVLKQLMDQIQKEIAEGCRTAFIDGWKCWFGIDCDINCIGCIYCTSC